MLRCRLQVLIGVNVYRSSCPEAEGVEPDIGIAPEADGRADELALVAAGTAADDTVAWIATSFFTRESGPAAKDLFARMAPPASATSRHTPTPLPETEARLRPRQRRRRRAGAESNAAWRPCLAALHYPASVSYFLG